ncbi:hypothetical protein ACFZCL_00665 [Streptomyces sp. NPDC008159]|uniref:hypothetical protein n=1 Tax=Streptomyces sp. NPDC008159 TaxID=3364817 RepID=UPI0036E125A1
MKRARRAGAEVRGFYSNCAIAWVVALVAASGLSVALYFHALGDTLQPYSPAAALIACRRPDDRRAPASHVLAGALPPTACW